MYLTLFGSCSQLDNRTEGLDVAYSLVSVTDYRLLTFDSVNEPTHSGSSCKFSVARLLGNEYVQRPYDYYPIPFQIACGCYIAEISYLCW